MSVAQEEELTKFSKRLDEIVEKVKAQSKNKTSNWFDDEFDALQERDRCTRNNLNEFITSTLGTNLSKNRFHNVWANESTLVHLTTNSFYTSRNNNDEYNYSNSRTELVNASNNTRNSDHNSNYKDDKSAITALSSSTNDYINANIIDLRNLFHVPFAYIAAQSPLPNTVNDFWHMIFMYNVRSIVMLCAEVEEGQVKSEKYWPDVKETRLYGELRVRTLSETLIGSVVHRLFLIRAASSHDQAQSRNFNSVNKESCTLQRIVEQLQYTAWPHRSIPSTSVPLSYMMHKVGSLMGNTKSPIIVHCSGGLGRSGVFIAMHIALAQFELEQFPINLFDIVAALKEARTGMVQSREQYLFLYFAVRREMQRLVLQTRNTKTTRSLQEEEQEWLQRLNASSVLSLTPQALSITSAMQSRSMINHISSDNNIDINNKSHNVNVSSQPMINDLSSWRSFHCSAPALMPMPSSHSLSRRTSMQSVKETKWSPARLLQRLLATSSSSSANKRFEKLRESQISNASVCDAQVLSKELQEQHLPHHKKRSKSGNNNNNVSKLQNSQNIKANKEEYTHNSNNSNNEHAWRTHLENSVQPTAKSLECNEDVSNRRKKDNDILVESCEEHLQVEHSNTTNHDNNREISDDVFINTNIKQERQETKEYIDVINTDTSLERAVNQSNEMSALHSLPVFFSSALRQCTDNANTANSVKTNEQMTIVNEPISKSPAVLEEYQQEEQGQEKAIQLCVDTKDIQLPENVCNLEGMNNIQKGSEHLECNPNYLPAETNHNGTPEMICNEVIYHRKGKKDVNRETELSRPKPTIANTVQGEVVIVTTNNTPCEEINQKTNESHQTHNNNDSVHSNTCQNIALSSLKKLTSAEIALL